MSADIALDSGKRVSNTWITYLEEGHSLSKGGVISCGPFSLEWLEGKDGLYL